MDDHQDRTILPPQPLSPVVASMMVEALGQMLEAAHHLAEEPRPGGATPIPTGPAPAAALVEEPAKERLTFYATDGQLASLAEARAALLRDFRLKCDQSLFLRVALETAIADIKANGGKSPIVRRIAALKGRRLGPSGRV